METSPQRQAITLNNFGAFQIEAGNFAAAISVLKDAHKCANTKNMSDVADMRLPVDFDESLELWMRQTVAEVESDSENDCDDEGFIVRHAIHIPISVRLSYQSQPAIAIAIIFNLALAYHLDGLHSSSVSRKEEDEESAASLKKAVKLYEYAFKLYRVNAKSKVTNPENTLFLMGAVNNSGQIYHVLGRDDAAATCFEELLSTLMVLRYLGQFNESRPRVIDASPCKGFFRNISQWMIQGYATSAGAA